MRIIVAFWLALALSSVSALEYTPLPPSTKIGQHAKADVPFDMATLKAGWKKRLLAMKRAGELPIIDIESSFNPGKLNARDYAEAMDANGIALTAFSAQIGNEKFRQGGELWHDAARRAVALDPSRYIPTTTAGIYPAFTEKPLAFVEETIARVKSENYPLMGEFEFRHYVSPRQYKRGESYRDVSIPIDGDAGHQLFQFAQQSGISFQIHYEVEDQLLPPLEKMLASYPKAKVIWCHLGQVRYAGRAKRYDPKYVRHLIETYPNIYFDLAFGDIHSYYEPSGEYHARVWQSDARIKQEWRQLVIDHPYRFMAALDIGGDRMNEVAQKSKTLRAFINDLPPKAQEIVAYKAAWKLLFNEDI